MKIHAALIFTACSLFNPNPQPSFDTFTHNFVIGYQALPIPGLAQGYIDDLKEIEPKDTIKKELVFFNSIKDQLRQYNVSALSAAQRQDYLQIKFETTMNLERLELETKWLTYSPATVLDDNMAAIPDGKAWYAYLLKRWLGADVTPDEIFKFGMNEVADANTHINLIRRQTGLDSIAFYRKINSAEFLINDSAIIQKRFEQTRENIGSRLNVLFYPHQIPLVKIKQGPKELVVHTPGFYRDGTFYYNLSDKPYNSRQFGWLFLHEAIPGHHYQTSIDKQEPHSKVQDLFFYVGSAEGWGAYVERYGKELGVYKTPYDELGHWEWNVIRAVRIPLDIGVNYYGWTDQQALAFWKKHVNNQDDIAMREIQRVRHWSVQSITYNYGAAQIAQWKAELQAKLGDMFNIKDFHEWVLANLSLPFAIAKENVFKKAGIKASN
ncbi:protein of unknown function [Mucilaginibacter mallensis]|uniref:DUF885 domain-containing protein n=1 Tax=Mucilaginibacter mallensis TaxID=652787 RepID=A0A1H2CFL6_MUCMA|nr:DUF885 domain-containing protein [Mucilaginibacter mallensis]SDT69032.1 protein of unknown function [Mucilaginibacter mallensis]